MEPSTKHQSRNVPVVYYLCRNRHLEHPHFIEVPLSSPGCLYLRDVIDRLNVLRGRDMASMYSWSCKRIYKNGFVWHDLCEDDLILPAHGNEYILKGSVLCEEFHSDYVQPGSNSKLQNSKQLQEPTSSGRQETSSSSSSMFGKETKTKPRPSSCDMSPDSSVRKNHSWGSSTSLTEYNVYKGIGAADASTQTDQSGVKTKSRENCTRGVSTDDGSLELECKENSEVCRDEISPPPSSSTTSSGRTENLESLIRAESGKMNSFRMLEEEEVCIPLNKNVKSSNVLLQLITCGSISASDGNHGFGLIPTYRPRFSHSKFPSTLYSSSVILGKLNCLSENSKLMGLSLEDKEYFSGNLIETNTLKGGDKFAALKHSSSYNADRICKSSKSSVEKDDVKDTDSARSKCIPRSIKASLSKTIRSPISQVPRKSCSGADNSQPTSSGVSSNNSSKRISQPSSEKPGSKRQDSFREEKVIQIEERLASGARVIIQSKGPCEDDTSSFDV